MGEVIKRRAGEPFEVRLPFQKVYPGFAYRAVFVLFESSPVSDDEDEFFAPPLPPTTVIQTDLMQEPKLTLDGELILSGVVPKGVEGYFPLSHLEIVRLSDNETKHIDANDLP